MQPISMPRYVDAMPQIFLWEMDELVVVAVMFCVGLVTREMTWCLLLSIPLTRMFSNWKGNNLDGILTHLFYGWGVLGLNKVFTNGNIKEYVQ